jgi:hypothetical protein
VRYIATALVSIILSAGVSVGITHSVMQEHNRQEVQRARVSAFKDGACSTITFEDGSSVKEDGNGRLCVDEPTVESLTASYGPCGAMQETEAGRVMYRDLVSDDTDNGERRSVRAQAEYVKQGCRNGA